MKQLFILLFIGFGFSGFAQNIDSLTENKVIVFKDPRLDILAKKESEINTAILKTESRLAKGYRLMVLNTSDKDYAFKVRAQLLQTFPEQKPYMWFANPYIRIKFGNFRTKEEAEVYRKQISKMLNGANIYYLPETIEVVPDKDFDPDSMK
ncbi:MAG: SPOR domain-containing protein [Bacteroidota bacterium]|nr:SPOR domain-containing protein [Bacteroidota bacterium]